MHRKRPRKVAKYIYHSWASLKRHSHSEDYVHFSRRWNNDCALTSVTIVIVVQYNALDAVSTRASEQARGAHVRIEDFGIRLAVWSRSVAAEHLLQPVDWRKDQQLMYEGGTFKYLRYQRVSPLEGNGHPTVDA